MSLRPSRLRGRGAKVGLPILLCNRKDLVALMRESPFLLHKRSAMDAHAAIRSYTARRCCDGAQSGTRPSKIEGMGGGAEVGLPTLLFHIIGKYILFIFIIGKF